MNQRAFLLNLAGVAVIAVTVELVDVPLWPSALLTASGVVAAMFWSAADRQRST